MTAKKIATTLGTGTLGAGGAGAAAWNFGLLGGNDLELNAESDANQQLKDMPSTLSGAPQAGAQQESATRNQGNDGRVSQAQGGTGGSPGGGEMTPGPKVYFAGATDRDKKVIDSGSNQVWNSTVFVSGGIAVAIKNGNDGDTSNLWICRLEAVILGNSGSVDKSEFESQGNELVGKIKNNVTKREQFVKNCSVSRTENEQNDGGRSVIYLETEKVGNKFKFKDQDIVNLLTKDFTGVYKLGDDEENVLSSMEWKKKEEKVGEKQKKVTFNADFHNDEGKKLNWSCSFSGSPKIEKTFKDDKLEGILKTFGTGQSENSEKKKYILRNCMKNNKNIRGLEFKEEGDSWRLNDKSLKDITEGMYENPIEAPKETKS